MRGDSHDAGFTLLEVVVALAIAGLALTALFSGAATGLRASQVSGDTMEALSLARSHLAEVGHRVPLVPGTRSGDDGRGLTFRLRIVAMADIPMVKAGDNDAAAVRQAPRVVLFSVSVAESWSEDGRARQVQLSSQRVGERPSEGP